MRVAVSARSTDRLRELVKELGPDAIMLPADLTSPAETDELIHQAIAKLGRLDVLFANAGVYIAGQVADGDPAEWDKLLALNVGSVFRSINRVIPHMRANGGGDILVSSSISAYQAIHFEPVYSASKHALNAFLYGVRRQVIRDKIRVGAIAPATVLNELWGYTDPAQHRQEGRGARGFAVRGCRRGGGIHAQQAAACRNSRPGDAASGAGYLIVEGVARTT